MPNKIAVVISQGQSAAPDKRQLEEDLVAALLFEQNCEVTLIPHLYDLSADGTGTLCLRGIAGDMIVLSWLFPRAAHWTLSSHGVRGRLGTTLLAAEEDHDDANDDDADGEDDESGSAQSDSAASGQPGGADAPPAELAGDAAQRTIYHLDLRTPGKLEAYLAEIQRIVSEAQMQPVSLLGSFPGLMAAPATNVAPAANSATRTNGAAVIDFSASPFVAEAGAPERPTSRPAPQESLASGANGSAHPANDLIQPGGPLKLAETPARRWYPVIDYSRCTNCMECIDFCLFGVYGVDRAEQILVEQPDNCRKGCPACSRVCPENAIIFPQHKSPAIAGSNEESAGGLKIDLSQLFGAPNAIDVAAAERDEQLVAVGRDAVGLSVGIPKRRGDSSAAAPKDDLDALMDKLDELPL